MPIVSFWSTVESTQTSTTSTAVAVANAITSKRDVSYKTLLTRSISTS